MSLWSPSFLGPVKIPETKSPGFLEICIITTFLRILAISISIISDSESENFIVAHIDKFLFPETPLKPHF